MSLMRSVFHNACESSGQIAEEIVGNSTKKIASAYLEVFILYFTQYIDPKKNFASLFFKCSSSAFVREMYWLLSVSC